MMTAKIQHEDIDFKFNLSLYFNLLKKYKGLFLILLASVLIIEASFTADKFLLKELIDWSTNFVSKTVAVNAYTNFLFILLAVFLALIILRTVFSWLRVMLLNRVEASLMFDLKRKFFNHILHLSYNFHTTHKTGSLISRLGRGNRAVERMTDILAFNLAPLIFQAVVVVSSLAYFDKLSGMIVMIVVVLFIIYSFIIQQKQKKANVVANDAEDFEKAQISDIFTNVDSVKYFGKESSVKRKFSAIIERTRKALIRYWSYYRWLDAGQGAILGVGTILILYFPLVKLIHGDLTIGTLVFIYTSFENLMGPLTGFVHGMRNFYRVMADFEALFRYAKIKNEVKDMPNAKKLVVNDGSINFKDVTFRYHKRSLFKDFNLYIPQDKKIALVGRSGCGKTTLIKLLYRFYDIKGGEILIDGHNIKEFKKESLRSELSIVPQECVLFDDTIYNNIAFSKPHASRREVLKTIKLAQLDKFIDSLSDKERTIVGERGVRLSGGEKQRVSIARAMLANKKILLLDEATSSLDSETEHAIQQDLARLMKGRTSIIIAHRLSTIMKADKIVVLENGHIVQMGSHKQLIAKSGPYRRLWNLQKGGYIK